MRRFRKVLTFAGACALALFLTIQHRGEEIRLATNAPLSAAVRSSSAAYDLSQIPVFTKALYFVNNNYFDKTRLDPKRMLVGALDFLQRDVPEILDLLNASAPMLKPNLDEMLESVDDHLQTTPGNAEYRIGLSRARRELHLAKEVLSSR